ncbi:hypothetical protein L1987_65007 [Smallanthus sonchifolius]|uniref:Uncharacterized protein n=1 Tax=Smallanthus sonchifolius TaxID=185202 RepID=A0ACB9BTB0_9ASTR|nr:hypothetical protein L1987_65007 [Smallanthus sonchifolius]
MDSTPLMLNGNCFGGVSDKIIIDTDPGIDDSMAIMMAFQTPNLEILGLTTIFGNVSTKDATRNTLLLCEMAGRHGVPVAEGNSRPLKGGEPETVEFVHGSDGLGNVNLPDPKSKKADISASEFLVDKVSQYPGEISILALGPLTNLAMIYGDLKQQTLCSPLGQYRHQDLDDLRQSAGKHAQFLCDITKFYRDWHVKSDDVYGIFLHDPVSFVLLVRPDLFTYKKGIVRVETQGLCVGHTLMDQGLKKWNTENPWTGYWPVSVVWTVNVDEVLKYIKTVLMTP